MDGLPAAEPILGPIAGISRQRMPLAELHPFAGWIWSYTVGNHGRPVSFVPDGFPDVMWAQGAVWIAGPLGAAAIESIPAGARVVGIALRPGMIANWLRVPPAELIGLRVPLKTFLPKEAERIVNVVGDASDPSSIASRLEQAFAGNIRRIDPPDVSYESLLGQLATNRNTTVRELAEALGSSERTLRRRCENFFGYGPKLLHRVVRIRRFLLSIRSHSDIELADLAAAAGYADQAHLTREARLLTGLTPSMLVTQLQARRTCTILT